jgi:aminoglycoside 3-N-acetyltransferase
MRKIRDEILPSDFEGEMTGCLGDLGIRSNDHVYVTGNLAALGRVHIRKEQKKAILLKAFQDTIGSNGTLFSPAASMNLCNTDMPFDLRMTPSHQMGAFAEYLRKKSEAERSLHPFWSVSGIGPEAHRLRRVSRHSYGAGSPWSMFLELDATQVNIGVHPSKAVTLIHHIETTIGVPYRYTKEFMHPIRYPEDIIVEPYYMSVMYKDSDIQKKLLLNEHYFEELDRKGLLLKSEHPTGLKLWSFKMMDFYETVMEFFIDDIYTYLEQPPSIRPYAE